MVAELDEDASRFERVASWWDEKKPTFLDPVLVDRCDYGFHNREEVSREVLKTNADALVAVARHIGPALVEDMSLAAGHRLKTPKLPVYWIHRGKWPRPDLWVDWRVDGEGLRKIALRLWISHIGAAIGVMPGVIRKGWKVEAEEVIRSTQVDGFRKLERGDDMQFFGSPGTFLYGCSYRPEQLADLDLRAEAREVATAARPVLSALISRVRCESPPPPPPKPRIDPLTDAVAEFRLDTGYPTAKDNQQSVHQRRLREMLLPENLAKADRTELRKIWTRAYGYPGAQTHLTVSLTEADDTEYRRILRTVEYLCWGDDTDADRIDAVLNDADHKVKGLGESVILKLLAICHPDRYGCVYPYSGKHGKLRMLRAIDLAEPSAETTRGRKHVESNERLRKRLDPFFPGDPWA